MAAFPLRAVYMKSERLDRQPPVQVLISVPKKYFKHAVDRNRVKRQLREAYRHRKPMLTEALPSDQMIAIAFVWISSQHLPSAAVDGRMKSLLERIVKRCNAAE